MKLAVLAALMLLQEVSGPVPPGQEGMERPTPFNDFEDLDRAPLPVRTIHEFGACVADASPLRATSLLSSDFTTRAYNRGLHDLADNNRGCLKQRGSMRSADLLFAGAMAERLLEKGSVPVNVQLARAAAASAAASYSPSDRAAMCLVRSLPDDVARLFATEVTSAEETEAAGTLQPILQRCSPEVRIEVSTEGLRAMLATAAFRSTQAVQTAQAN